MTRRGIFFRIKPGNQAEYKRLHASVWPEVEEALRKSGIHNYSIWNLNDMLFSYYEVDDPNLCASLLAGNEYYQKWRKLMEEVVFVDRATGQKEWDMDIVFFLT
jgi:L-rhamnose mutarotase